jgi:hypothetical protein
MRVIQFHFTVIAELCGWPIRLKGADMIRTFAFFLLFLSLAASAKNYPTKLHVLKLPSVNAEASGNQKREVLENLNKAIRQVSNGEIELPENLDLYIPSFYSNAFFFGLADLLVTPFQIRFSGQSKHPKFTRGVELHEFGHSVFLANLPKLLVNRNPEYHAVNLYLQHRNKLAGEARKYLGFMVSVEHAANAQDKQELESYYKYHETKFKILFGNNLEIFQQGSKVISDFGAFNEFFADVFAVVLTRDPDVIRDALQFSSHVAGNQSDRSFRLRRSKRALQVTLHNLYSLSRHYIYKYYLSDPQLIRKGASWNIKRTLNSIRCSYENLDRVIDAIEKDIKYYNIKNVNQFVIERLNANLNSCIDTEFSKAI